MQQHLWLLVVGILFVGCINATDVCIFYDTIEEEIDARVYECDSQIVSKGFEVVIPNMKYYLLHSSYNDSTFVSQITSVVNSVIVSTSSAALVAVVQGTEDSFMLLLPPRAEILSISLIPQLPFDAYRIEQLKELYQRISAPDPLIQRLVNQVSSTDLRNWVEYLSGELSGSPILTRNSLSEGAVLASDWLTKQFTSFGFRTSYQQYQSGYSRNVAATLLGSTLPGEVVVVGAHYDSRASSSTNPTQRAPGANDDGSGTGTLLQIAKVIFSQNTKFKRTILLVAFSGEEQGLLGSQAYAKSLSQNKTNVFAMVQNDMIAYRAPGTDLLCGFPLRYTTPELTQLAIATSNLYSPTLTTGRNDRCCSDHRSFYELGFPTTDFSDTLGPITDPQYHAAGDLVNRPGFDFVKYSAIVKAILATVAVLAEPLQ